MTPSRTTIVIEEHYVTRPNTVDVAEISFALSCALLAASALCALTAWWGEKVTR